MHPIGRSKRSPSPGANASRGGRGLADPPLDEADLYVKLRAYLECRSRNIDPPPPLAEAWARFYDLNAPRIRAFLVRFNLSEADRDDCLQDVWSKVIARLASLTYDPRRARLSTWLLTVARNQAVDAIRRRRRIADPIEDAAAIVDNGPDPAATYDRLSRQDRVRTVLSELSAEVPALSFQVLHLRTIQGCTTAEVADTLGLTSKQVRFRLHRAKHRFRDLYEHMIEIDHSEGEVGRTLCPGRAKKSFPRNTADLGAYNK